MLENELPSALLRANPDIKSWRKNFAYVSIGFADANVNLVEETQEITLRDMYIFIGGNIGLFLGMSFTSVFEIAVELFLRTLVFAAQHARKLLDRRQTIKESRKSLTKRKTRYRKAKIRVTSVQQVASL